MKKLYFFIFIIYSMQVFCGYGVVIKYNTFSYQFENTNSKKIQSLQKGDKIYVHDKYFDFSNKTFENSIFLETLDQNGLTCFILKNDIKLIFGDMREQNDKIAPKNDFSDFRSPEPLNDHFPFKYLPDYIGTIDFGYYSVGNFSKYNYPLSVTKENFGIGGIFKLSLLKRANWDKQGRFFIGGNVTLTAQPARFQLGNDFFSTELSSTFEIGPSINYNFFQKDQNTFSLIASINVTYHKSFVKIEDINGVFEDRKFSSLFLKPNISILWQRVIPQKNYNFYLGFSNSLIIPHSLLPSTKPISTNIWSNNNDFIATKLSLDWSLFLGFSNHF